MGVLQPILSPQLLCQPWQPAQAVLTWSGHAARTHASPSPGTKGSAKVDVWGRAGPARILLKRKDSTCWFDVCFLWASFGNTLCGQHRWSPFQRIWLSALGAMSGAAKAPAWLISSPPYSRFHLLCRQTCPSTATIPQLSVYVYVHMYIQGASKRWTQFQNSIFHDGNTLQLHKNLRTV